MTRRRATHIDAAAIEALLGSKSTAALDRALLEACVCLRDVRAVALWKRLRVPGREEPPSWCPVVARSSTELLPSEALVRAALSGAIDGESLPGGARVIRSLIGPSSTALVVCGGVHEDERDQIVAWIQLHDAIERVLGEGADFHGPIPRNAAPPIDPPSISGDAS